MNTAKLYPQADGIHVSIGGQWGRLPSIIKKGGDLYFECGDEEFSSYQKIQVAEGEPLVRWAGDKMPFSVWYPSVAFLLWNYGENKDEGMVRFYHNKQTHIWKAWAPPQEGHGMTVKALPDHPEFARQSAEIGQGFVFMAELHDHCNSTAFQSGTDSGDEADKEARLQITLGGLGSASHSLHVRGCFRGVMSGAVLSDWFEMPDWVDRRIPYKYRSMMLEDMLKEKPPEGTTFPEFWKLNIIKASRSVTVYGGLGFHGHHYPQHAPHHAYSAPNWNQHDGAKLTKKEKKALRKMKPASDMAMQPDAKEANGFSLSTDELEMLTARLEGLMEAWGLKWEDLAAFTGAMAESDHISGNGQSVSDEKKLLDEYYGSYNEQ